MGKERQRAEKFAGELQAAYGDSLVSVVLYGSAARGDYREGSSDLNVLVLLRGTEPALLRRGSALARAWAAEGNPPPLVMGDEEWRRSADVFPIEYGDIRDAHLVLYGPDPLEGVRVDWEHLRLQCEHELKGKQIQLREHYLLRADDPEQLGALLLRSLSTFLTLFRSALRLAGESPPRDPEAVISALAARVGFDPEPLRALQRARAEGRAPKPSATDPLVSGYMEAVERTTHWLDGLTSPSTPPVRGA